MKGWKYEWVGQLPADVYQILVEWIQEQQDAADLDDL